MPIFEAEINGQIFEIEANDENQLKSSIDLMIAAPQQMRPEMPEDYSPTSGMTTGERFMAGAGKAVYDVGRGIGQMTGMVPQSAIDEARARDAALMQTGAGMAGNLAGQVASAVVPGRAMMAAPGMIGGIGRAIAAPSSIGQAVTGGAVMGAVQPSATGESRLETATEGALGGGLGYGAAAGLGRMLAPQVSPAAQDLISRGVVPTPGQMAGGAFNRIEQGMTSVPVLGDAVIAARQQAAQQFNRAIGNEVLASVGEKVPPNIQPGTDMVNYVQRALSNKYETLLPSMSAKIDKQFRSDLSNIKNMAGNLPKDQAGQLRKLIQETVEKRIGGSVGLRGETIKEIQSSLTSKATQYKSSGNPDQRIIGEALSETARSLRELVKRSNPDKASELSAIDQAYSKLTRLETAAQMAGSQGGVFSPEAFRSAVRAGDMSVRNRAFAGGRAPMQDIAEAGVDVLGRTVPDSGTAFRGLTGAGALGGLAAVDPLSALTALGASGMYASPQARQAVNTALFSRPQAMRQLGLLSSELAPASGIVGAGMGRGGL
jgi:hypothetical protein